MRDWKGTGVAAAWSTRTLLKNSPKNIEFHLLHVCIVDDLMVSQDTFGCREVSGAVCRPERATRRRERSEVVCGRHAAQLLLLARLPGRRLLQGDVRRRQQVGGTTHDVSR